MNATKPGVLRPATRIPPPLWFATAFLAGFFAHRRLVGSPGVPDIVRIIGIVLTAGGAALAFSAAGLFVRQRTTLIPHGKSSTLVVRGPYRFTRNPMYLSLSIVYLGATLWTGAWLALALLAIPLWVINRLFIPMEERQLRERFGESYATYCARVRRWM